jgi:S1-C subfamily serine protease
MHAIHQAATALVAALLLTACEAPEPPLRVTPRAAAVPPAADAPRGDALREAAPQPPAQHAAGVLERLGVAVKATPHGLTIIAIDLDGPAAQAGAQVGDVVAAVNGDTVANATELDRLVAAAAAYGAPKPELRLDLRRKGAAREVAVKLGEMPNAAEVAAAWNPLGLQVRELPEQHRKALGVVYGVMVTKVRAPADRTRILPGDVIIAVDYAPIRSMEEFNRRVAERKSPTIGLLVRRSDSDLFIPLEAAAADSARGRDGDASRGGSAPGVDERLKRRQAIDTPLRT